jgi:hypothetical protein
MIGSLRKDESSASSASSDGVHLAMPPAWRLLHIAGVLERLRIMR